MSTGQNSSADKAPFIADQGMRLLREQRQPKQYVGSSAFAVERKSNDKRGGESPAEQGGHWEQISRNQVARDTNSNVSLNRTVIVNDAGLGKSTTAEWLRYEYSRSSSEKLAFVIEISELKRLAETELYANPPMVVGDGQPDRRPTIHDLFVERLLLDKFSLTDEPKRTDEVRAAPVSPLPGVEPLRRLIEAGRVVLIFDALDQAPDIAVAVLGRLLKGNCWATCRIVLTSRPYALDQHWKTLFQVEDEAPGWRFVRLDEFTEPQQRAYMGNERFYCIPMDAREILTVPRVLYYLRKLTVAELSHVSTASDAYYLATQRMIIDGLAAVGSHTLDPEKVRRLLSVIAFRMVTAGANFDALSGHGAVAGLQSAIGVYCVEYEARGQTNEKRRELTREYNRDWIKKRLEELAAINDIVDCGMLERGCPNHFQFRNRSLQEFFAAQFLSSYCTESALPQIESILYWEANNDSLRFRNVWRMFAEMPLSSHDAESWLTVAGVLYLPGTGRSATTRRSTEMIYRTWSRVEDYENSGTAAIQTQASNILSDFQGEFQKLLGAMNPTAVGLVGGFQMIPAGEFMMGSPADEEYRKTDEVQHMVFITRVFLMHRYQLTNAGYELFDPGHRAKRDKYNNEDTQPVVDVSWYDAWCFAKWLYYCGKCCSLPTEAEWEYSCRAGTTTRFWSGVDDKDLDRAAWYRSNSEYTTHPVGQKAANAWGLYDTHGNVFEWCADSYETYPHGSEKDPGDLTMEIWRVLRGGSFDILPEQLRSAYRFIAPPDFHFDNFGFRISRIP